MLFSDYLMRSAVDFEESQELEHQDNLNVGSTNGLSVTVLRIENQEMFPKIVILLQILMIMRVLKLIKMAKIGKILRSMEELITKDEIMLAWTFIKFIGRVLVVAHWFACFYWILAEYELYNDEESATGYEKRPWPIAFNLNLFNEVPVKQ